MNEHDDRSPRRIETEFDVIAVLESRAASFIELMDCVAVAAAAKSWQLRHRAAERAFSDIVVDSPLASGRLVNAAEIIMDTYLKTADSLTELPDSLDDANRWIGVNRSKLDLTGAGDFADEQLRLFAELQVLLSNPEADAKVRLCARLRKVDRADLGIEAVRPVAIQQRDNVQALTTLGAAYCDVRDFQRAERVLETALKVRSGDTRALLALSRVFQDSGRLPESLNMAKMAFSFSANRYSAHRLLAAARASEDADSIDVALQEIQAAVGPAETGQPDVYLLLLAAEALLDLGRLRDVIAIMEQVVASGVTLKGATAKRFSALRQTMRTVQGPTLFEDPLNA